MDLHVARCHLLAEVLSADGMMAESERLMLEGTMERLGLDEAARQGVRDFQDTAGAAEALAALPELARQEVLDMLVDAALVDGKLSPNETAAVKRIAQALGLG